MGGLYGKLQNVGVEDTLSERLANLMYALESLVLDEKQYVIATSSNKEVSFMFINGENFSDSGIIKAEKKGAEYDVTCFENTLGWAMDELARRSNGLPKAICPRDDESPDDYMQRAGEWIKENER